MGNKGNRDKLGLMLVLLVSLGLRLVNLNQSLWLDEAIEWWAVKSFGLRELLTGYMVGDFNPPGHHVLMWFWVRIFGESEMALRMPSVIFGVGIVWWVYKIGKIVGEGDEGGGGSGRNRGDRGNLGLLAAGMAAVNGLLIYYSQEARMYAVAAFFVSGAMCFFMKGEKEEKEEKGKKDKKDYLLYFGFMAAAMYSHYLTWLLLPFLAIWGFRYTLPVLVTVPWWPILFKQLQAGMVAAGNPVWAELSQTNFKNLALVAVKFVTGRMPWPDGWGQLGEGVIVFGFWMIIFIGVIRVIREIRQIRDPKLMLILWAFGPAVLGGLIGLVIPVFSYFRFLFVAPAVMVLAAKGIERLAPAVRSPLPSRRYVGTRRGVATAGFGRASAPMSIGTGPSEKLGRWGIVGAMGVFSLMYIFNSDFHREDWRGAVGELHRLDEAPVVIIHLAVRPPFDYYDRRSGVRGQRSVVISSQVSVVRYQGSDVLWYIPYAQAIFDPEDTVRKELRSLGYTRDYERHFRGVTLERWTGVNSIAYGIF